MRRHLTLLAALALAAAMPACRPADASTYGKQTGAAPSSVAGAIAFNGVTTFNAEVSMPGVADFQASAITFNAPLKLADGGSSPYVWGSSPEIDLTVTQSNMQILPAVAGKTLVITRISWLVTQTSGALTTGATTNAGTGVAKTNISPSSVIFASAAFSGGPGYVISQSPVAAVFPASSAALLDVTSPATGTGGFVFKGKLIIQGFYI